MLILPGKPNVREPIDVVIKLIEGDFKLPDLKDRIAVIADVNHFKHMEDESVWEQARGKKPNYYEIYWDGVWIADFDENSSLIQIRLDFLKGFAAAYEEGRVYLNTKDELAEHEVETAAQKTIREIEGMKVESTEDAIVKEALTDLVKDNKPKKKLSKV